MTKKSYARQLRDAKTKEIEEAEQVAKEAIKDNTVYDDIKGIYQECGETLGGYVEAFNRLNIPTYLPDMTNEQRQKMGTLASSFKSDVQTLADNLLEINKPFKDKSGGEQDMEQYIKTVGVADQFNEFIGRCKGALDPTFRGLASEISVVTKDPEIINLINKQMQEGMTEEEIAAVNAQNAQDKDIVTDVEIKEPVKDTSKEQQATSSNEL